MARRKLAIGLILAGFFLVFALLVFLPQGSTMMPQDNATLADDAARVRDMSLVIWALHGEVEK